MKEQTEIVKEETFPEKVSIELERITKLRKGENSHQKAALYRVKEPKSFNNDPCLMNSIQLNGKELSFNNIIDGNRAIEAMKDFTENPTCIIIKHATPCGIASSSSLLQAWKDAFATDIYSPFGGIVIFNRKVDADTAKELLEIFLELVIAPSFEAEALQILRRKKQLRIIKIKELYTETPRKKIEFKEITGGYLAQERDIKKIDTRKWQAVTNRKLSGPDEINSAIFAVRCVKNIKSNSVVFVKDTATVGIGGGQTARVDASWIATHKGKENIEGSIMASDAFFPFRDAVDLAAEAGVKVIIQPGGSIRDEEVIKAANERNIAMIFTSRRYFLH